MKKIFLFLSIAFSLNSIGQSTGGVIRTPDNSGTVGYVKRISDNFKVVDSTNGVILTAINGKLPTLVSGKTPTLSDINSTIFSVSTLNTTANINASTTLTTAIEALTNKTVFGVSIFADQPITVHILQYIDAAGTKLVSDAPYTRAANVGINEWVGLAGLYLKIQCKIQVLQQLLFLN